MTSTKTNSTLNNPLKLAYQGRGIIVGQTGSGKSELAKVLTEDADRLFVIDPKRMYKPHSQYVVVEEVAEIPSIAQAAWNPEQEIRNRVPKGVSIVVWRPEIEVVENMEEQNRVWQWIYKTRNMRVYVDELLSIVKSAMTYPISMKACYVQGRELNIEIIGATQRPSGIPVFTIESCRQFWKFFLAKKGDQERMAEYMGDIVIEPNNLPARSSFGETRRKFAHGVQDFNPHSFYYFWQGQNGDARQYVLDIQDERVEALNGNIRHSIAAKH